jgi:hypothetical protein
MVDIELNQNIISQYIEKSFRHLQNLPLSFHIYDYLKYYSQNKELLYRTLLDAAKKLNIDIDEAQLTDQKYLNFLHKTYEFGYNKGSNVWLEFHEMIHAIEALNNNNLVSDQVTINYRELSGPLEKPFNRNYLEHAVQSISKGTCYCQWNELGKSPYRYWSDNEPDDIARIYQLAKPWTVLRPSVTIALEDIDFTLSQEDQQRFDDWFSGYKESWMQHWNLDHWDEKEMTSVIPIGQISDVDELKEKIYQGNRVTKVHVR